MGKLITLAEYLTVRDTPEPSPWLQPRPDDDDQPPPPPLKLRLAELPDIVA